MFPYSKSVNPAVRTHLDSQVAYLNDLSSMVSHSFQQVCQANIQLGQTMLEETMTAGQRMFTTENGPEALSAAASRAQPAADKLRAYQQHISQLAADAQVELARVNEQHAPITSQSAQELVKEVKRVAVEETDRNVRRQEEALQTFRDPFKQEATGQQSQPSDGARGQTAQSTPQPGSRSAGKRPD